MLTIARLSIQPRLMEMDSASLPGRIAIAVMATVLVALAAHISLPVPFSPVPLTLQPFAVLLVGMLLGPAAGFGAMLLYLGEGVAGLPVFSPLGLGGVAQLMGPTGGYLLSYPLAAMTAGWLVRSLRTVESAFVRGLVAAALATALIFLFGTTWLAALLHLHAGTALRLGVLPFLPGEAVKLVAAATLYSAMVSGRKQPASASSPNRTPGQ